MEWKYLLNFLDVAAPLAVLLVVLFTLLRRRSPLQLQDRLLIAFILLQLLFNTSASIMELQRINNLWIYHLNCLTTQLIFAFYFSRLFRKSVRARIVIATTVFFFVFFLANAIFIQPLNTFNSYTYALGAFFIMAYGLMSFYRWMQALPTQNILELKEFWGAAGVLFYFGSSFFIFISYQYLSHVTPATVGVLWWLHNIFLMLGCIIFAKAILAKEWIQGSSSSPARPSSHFL